MNRFVLAASILAMTASGALAEVTLSGDARIGLIYNDGATDFTSRARVTFAMSGESDDGLSFGATFRADNAVAASTGLAGSVYMSGSFGKVSIGDVDGAAAAAVGQVSAIGVTDLFSFNEIGYALGTEDPSVLYEYGFGAGTLYASWNDQGDYGLAGKYVFGAYTLAAGFERIDANTDVTGSIYDVRWGFGPVFINGVSQYSLGATAAMGDATVKGVWAHYVEDNFDGTMDQYAISVDYKMGAATVTGVYSAFSGNGLYSAMGDDAYGLGVSYDLGGGATVKGGVASLGGDTVADLGLALEF
jgi:outer membrane protein OmpU